MRIRTAKSVGFVRHLVALVVVLMVVSDSAAFGQQSGRMFKPSSSNSSGVQKVGKVSNVSSNKATGVKPQPIRREPEIRIQTEPVYVDADRDDIPGPRSIPPPIIDPPNPFGDQGVSGGGGGNSSGSAPPSDPPDENGSCFCIWEQTRVDRGTGVPGCGDLSEHIIHELRFRCTFKAGGSPCHDYKSRFDCQHILKITDISCLPPPPNPPVTILTKSECINCYTNNYP